MNRSRWLWLLSAVAGLGMGGCKVETSSCFDDDLDGICDDVDDCIDIDGDGLCDEVCIDDDFDGICDDVDDCIDVDEDGECDGAGCFDDDLDGVCNEDDCFPDDSYWSCADCDDLDGDALCDPLVGDFDFDGIPDEEDCYDDINHEFLCADPKECTAAENFCGDPWYLVYCADGGAGNQFFGADCNDSCQNDPAVYGDTCGGPAVAGECSDGEGLCLCYCEDSFDQCVNDYVVQYTRDGTTYQEDCKVYCTAIGGNGGSCDAEAGACACD